MSKSGRRVEMCSAMYLSSIAVYSAKSIVLRRCVGASGQSPVERGRHGRGGRVGGQRCVAGGLLDQLVLLALVELVAVLLHEAAYEVVEALVHHDVLEHRDHAFEGTRIDLAAESTRRSSGTARERGELVREVARGEGVRTRSHRRE